MFPLLYINGQPQGRLFQKTLFLKGEKCLYRENGEFLYNLGMVKLNRPHIGVFGRMNAGKSSLVNVLSGQETAVVSSVPGTTTDPVRKNMEILGVGPVTLVDTAGLDDLSVLGEKRVAKTREILEQTDLAIIVFAEDFGPYERELAALCRARKTPFFFVHNKRDIYPASAPEQEGTEVLEFSCAQAEPADLISAVIRHLPESSYAQDDLFGGFVREGDEAVLVIPVDASAPEGRLILPQVQTLRALLDLHATGICLQPAQLAAWLATHSPRLVITDSQAFKYVSSVTPASVPLTSFSILFSRLKGDFDLFLQSTPKIDALQEGDKVLILESCSHSVNKCDDIGRVKIPHWLQQKTGKKLRFDVLANLDPLPQDLSAYKLAVQCGGCMVTRKQILSRVGRLAAAGVPVSNYGMTIAWCTGIFDRVTEIFRR